ncbi:MAG: ACP phosphodiesterase [Cyanobacteria bacterium P01_G01_bin.19]
MNWLAHLLLAESTPEARLGNLLGDLIKGEARKALNSNLTRGLQCHQAIDIFTDKHPIVKRSKQRINPDYRRFAGILIDVFYDGILANNWQDYCELTLEQFVTDVYNSWNGHLEHLAPYPQGVIRRLIEEDWLGSYAGLPGIEKTLARISGKLNRRSNKQCDLTPAIACLTDNYEELEQDFRLFFPQLQSHINYWHSTN